MYKRVINLNNIGNNSVFLFGPRGTGKTSWLKQTYPNVLYFDLLNDDTYTELLARPTRLSEKIPADYHDWIIIDEVQKIPKLLDEVHRLIEHQGCQFILTGSSARKLKQKGVNLLAGRALTYHMHPLTTLELNSDVDLHRDLLQGRLPAVIHHPEPKAFLKSYVSTYLREEVLQEGLVRNLSLFARFLETASFSQGETLNYTTISRDVGTNRNRIAEFFDILEDLLIGRRLPCFTKHAKRDVVAHPKFYYFDVGVYRTIRPQGPLDSEQELAGAALETLFLQELMAINDYYQLDYTIYFWRTKNNVEVDFVVYGPKGLMAFEIKRRNRLNGTCFKGLKLFLKDYPMASCYMVYGGNETYVDNNIQVIPMSHALSHMKAILTGAK